jgi:N-formylglutamate deformylase
MTKENPGRKTKTCKKIQQSSVEISPIAMQNFSIQLPSGPRLPIVLSVPHCGTLFPPDVKAEFDPALIEAPDDTDWFVDRLYKFGLSVGITMISAVVSRWVIDLNRSPEDQPLYSDGRITTGLCPTTTFLGQPLYRDRRRQVARAEVKRRLEWYFYSYHQQLVALLDQVKKEFGCVLLWDCHSIRQHVPTIQAEAFPDLILGSADGHSADVELIRQASKDLSSGGYSFKYNTPFKGGYITRHYGDPARGCHALQLEMSKINYMNVAENEYHEERAEKMVELLNKTLSSLAGVLLSAEE